ncbi:MAG: translocation/assembly module TamB domain-containing protein [Acidobacteriota bacterium]|nr:translocation/assembly module TamB domain-containing protein [Acidobacteriota bacterium]
MPPEQLDPSGSAEASATPAVKVPPGRSRARRRWPQWVVVRALGIASALIAAGIVAAFTIDLGPSLKSRAEAEATQYLKRPMHIGKVSARLRPGSFVFEDVVIEGLTPTSRPFLTAKHISVTMPWWTLFRREVVFEDITITGWTAFIETTRDGRHNMPRLMPESKPNSKSRFRTTLKSVLAEQGEFTYEDRGTPWSVISRNLRVAVARTNGEYRGTAQFTGGTVDIQDYVPMRADMRSRFKFEGKVIKFEEILMLTDGAESRLTGEADLARWPEQTYRITSDIELRRMRELFFANERWELSGRGAFTGTFHMFKGGRDLSGDFRAAEMGVDAYRFQNVLGKVQWTPDFLHVWDGRGDLYGGEAAFTYNLEPLRGGGRRMAEFTTDYRDVDLATLTDFYEFDSLRLAGRITGRNAMTWPSGRFFAERRGSGVMDATPPSGVSTQGRVLAVDRPAPPRPRGPFDRRPSVGYVPVAGHAEYAFDGAWVTLAPGWAATPETYVEFRGRAAWDKRVDAPIHVTSSDWQASDRLLAAVLTAFGSRTPAIEIGGRGEFTGTLARSFSNPLIKGSFSGHDLRAWDVVWGSGRADVVIENAYATVTGGRLRKGDGEITATGVYSLGYPRRDRGEELDARVRIVNWPMSELRHAFLLDDWPVEGRVSGEYHLFSGYETPQGFGRFSIVNGTAWEEPFESITATLRFEGTGVRLDDLRGTKGGGAITGAAWVGWDGTYSFNADGTAIPVQSLTLMKYEQLPAFSGQLQFSASGTGIFEMPRYDVKFRIADLFLGEEGIGQVGGRLGIRGLDMNVDLEAASPRLTVSGSGRVTLNDDYDADLSFQFSDTSIDPYARLFVPKLSPFTTAVASGTMKFAGKLAVPSALVVDVDLSEADMSLFDYRVRNDGPLRVQFDRNVVRIGRMQLAGEGTLLAVTGEVGLDAQRISVTAEGDANLAVLQGFYRNVRSSGSASLKASITGDLESPSFSGRATLANGRVRHFDLPHGLEAINGSVVFDPGGLRVDGMTARMGGGDITFGGRVGFRGLAPDELNITALGTGMRMRYPEGFSSIVNADLALRGNVAQPLLTGTVRVDRAVWSRRFEGGAEFFSFGGGSGTSALPAAVPAASIPLQYDVRVIAPSSLQIDNNVARIVASADLTLRGTPDKPILFGRADIERGEVLFEGNRYLVTRGTVDFANPAEIQPFFDIEAETRVRVPGQTYRVTLRFAGTPDRITPTFTSDPPLPSVDVLSLLFGEAVGTENLQSVAEMRSLQSPQDAELELLSAGAARLLAAPISSQVGRVVERTLGVDTVQITPLLGDTTSFQQLSPTARLTLGKRISSRAFLTYARSVTGAQYEVILLEYDQSDRLSWIISRNEDRSFALDFRIRHSF